MASAIPTSGTLAAAAGYSKTGLVANGVQFTAIMFKLLFFLAYSSKCIGKQYSL